MEAASTVLHEQVEAGKTPAVQYRFVGPDSIIFRHDEGVADVALRRPVSNATTYHGFSVTKTFTALAVVQLVERRVLELDRPAADYLPDFPYAPHITIRQLLTHSSGIPNPVPLSWIHLREEHASFDRERFFRAVFARHSRVKAEPNAHFQYSNLGYVLLGQIIEKVCATGYEQYVTENILTPLGLLPDDLGFVLNDDHHARGYHRRNSISYLLLGLFLKKSKFTEPGGHGWQAFRPFHVNGVSYGGIIGTADGFARYVQGLINPASGLVSEESRRLLFAENLLRGGKSSGMCLSWFKGELDSHACFCHAGGGGGYYSELRLYPDLQRASIIVFNRSGMSDARFLDRVDRHLIAAGRSTGGAEVVRDREPHARGPLR
jgi:D-alanyl-D-alanine carboxypeptidase